MCPPEVLRRLAEVTRECDLLVLSDEIYENLVYDGFEHGSITALPEMNEGAHVDINGFAKAYPMTGWRIGYVAAPRPLIEVMVRIVNTRPLARKSFARAGAVAAL